MKTRLDLAGKKFGMLTVIRFVGLDARRNSRWLCRCDCGQEKAHTGNNLKRGNAKSCGCMVRRKRVDNLAEDHQDFSVFVGMLSRCNNEKLKEYWRYGGRGIKVCDRWRNGGFWVFISDMGPRPTPRHSLDRIDVNGNYEPSNCRWATKKEQSRNRRDNKVIEFAGKSMSAIEWSEELGINYRTLLARFRRGWPVKRAFAA